MSEPSRREGHQYLPAETLAAVRQRVPILCVDMLPFRGARDARECLLIRRLDRSDSAGWAMIGGRVWIDEGLRDAAARHLRDALGDDAGWRTRDWDRPDLIGEYMRSELPGRPFDPVQHAVALTYTLEIEGDLELGGEALGAAWFSGANLPADGDFVFGQGTVIRRLLTIAASREPPGEWCEPVQGRGRNPT